MVPDTRLLLLLTMNILVAEYAVGAGKDGTILLEGRAMLDVLVKSFERAGHRVTYPTSGTVLSTGTPFKTNDFENAIKILSEQCDAALLVAPDELLGEMTRLVEEYTVNLGCPSESVKICADKLAGAKALIKGGIRTPRTAISDQAGIFSKGELVVIKPRWGCASENTTLLKYCNVLPDNFVATEYIEGEHLSVSLILGDKPLLLTVNRQNIKIHGNIQYNGGTVGIDSGRNQELFETAYQTAGLLGCRGYVGVDIVLAEEPWVIDVNPRPTTSIIGISSIMDQELGELILAARFGRLPERVSINGEFTFSKADLA
jgi:predicted ATP-grasp superfamily ATP-dependent carboligase